MPLNLGFAGKDFTMDYFTLLNYRRSTRKFTGVQIAPEDLTRILTAANSAPVGSNRYGDIHLTVVQNRAVLDRLGEAAARRWQDKAKVKEIAADTDGVSLEEQRYDPFYGAPTVIFVSHRSQSLQPGIEFANVTSVIYSMHLAATALGLGSVFMWFALESMRELPALDHSPVLDLPEGFAPLLGLAVGHPAKELSPRDVKTDRITVNYLK